MKRFILFLVCLFCLPGMLWATLPKTNSVAAPAKVNSRTDGKVSGVSGGSSFSPVWVYNGGHTPVDTDSYVGGVSSQHDGGLIQAPVGATKVTKLRVYARDDATSGTVRVCLWPSGGGSALGGGDIAMPTSYGLWTALDITVDIAVTGGASYGVFSSVSTNGISFYYYGTTAGKETADAYSAGSCVSLGTQSDSYLWSVGAYFE